MSAMMAHELAAEPVLDERGRAVWAFEAMAAGAAESQRCIAAPVEEQKRLITAGKCTTHGLGQRLGEPCTALNMGNAHVERLDLRQFSRTMAGRKRHMAVAP